MFGFLRVPKAGLGSAENLLYQSHFCAVCHSLHAETGWLSSLFTNYDITFWTLLGASLEESATVARKRCTAFPWRTVPVAQLRPSARVALTAITHHLIGSKLEDDALDGERKWLGWALKFFRQPTTVARRALAKLNLPSVSMDNLFAAQTVVERIPGLPLESYCKPTREAMSEVFGYHAVLYERPELADNLQRVGWHLGGLLYLLDAATDRAEDLARHRFNAFARALSPPPARRALRVELESLSNALVSLPINESMGALCANLLSQLDRQIRALATHSAGGCDFLLSKGRRGICDCGGCDICCAGCHAGCGDGCCHGVSACGDCGHCCSGLDAGCCDCVNCCNCCPCPGPNPGKGVSGDGGSSCADPCYREKKEKPSEMPAGDSEALKRWRASLGRAAEVPPDKISKQEWQELKEIIERHSTDPPLGELPEEP